VRAVCCALGVSRSHVLAKRDRPSEWADLRKSPPRSDDTVIKQAIANVVKNRATYGYRRVWARLRLEGHDRVNHKRVYRVMRNEGWLLYRHGEKPVDTRKHEGKVAVKESDVRWCSDGLELSCDNGEKVRVAFALDCCDREIMSWVATTKGIDAALVGDLMMQAVENRFGPNCKPPKPIEWLTDNGSCYTAAETRSFAKQLGLKPVTTPVTSPQSNGMAESFVKTLKRDYAKLADRPDSKTVMAQLPKWFDDYNSYHPHSALGYVPAKLFREKRAVN
jgi:putative transposase